MYNYKVTDSSGQILGVLSLETEELPNKLMDGVGFTLGGSWETIPEKKFLEFSIMPDLRMDPLRFSRIVSDPELIDPVERMG